MEKKFKIYIIGVIQNLLIQKYFPKNEMIKKLFFQFLNKNKSFQ